MIQFNATKMLHSSAGPQQLHISFHLKEGRILTLYGPSGAGKTTILRMLAGLTHPADGLIRVDDQTWFSHKDDIYLPASRRPVGMVFQDFALFPNLSVRENLEYAANNRKADGPIIDELLSMMQLDALQHVPPAKLSGGQQQRVALARAIVRQPRLLLLDEPLSALDDEMRHQLQDHILQVHRRFNLTTILVSHDIPEIVRLSNEVVCLDKGRIVCQGGPQELFLDQQAQLGDSLKIMGEVLAIDASQASILVANQIIRLPVTGVDAQQLHIGDRVILVPETLRLQLAPAISQLP